VGWWAMIRFRDLYGRVMSTDDLSDAATDCRVLRIAFSSPEQVRSRRVVTRSRFRLTGKYPSWKMERMLQWESINELNAFRLLDCDPRVTVFTRARQSSRPEYCVRIGGSLGFWAWIHHRPVRETLSPGGEAHRACASTGFTVSSL
jgi:hypothetical protein